MRQRFTRFMYGRYGGDELYRVLSFTALAVLLLTMFFRNWVSQAGLAVSLALLVYAYFRAFSKNLEARRRENRKYLSLKRRFLDWLRLRRDMWTQRKEYRFFKCSSCRAVLRVPRGKGKIRILCKKCGAAFEKKT